MSELIDKLRGKIRELAGAATGHRRVEAKGKAEQPKGEVKGKAEEPKHEVKEAGREAERPSPS
ncbi:MAG: CsbD family protein [Myxococcales bacterium]|nr:CsbD family protein [Myxococcales bacterium]